MNLSIYNMRASVKGDELVIDKRREHVAIIAANHSYANAPFNNPDWEIWGCNSLWNYCRDQFGDFRADRWFELHPLSVQTKEEMKAIESCPVPIYLLEPSSSPKSIEYPLGDVLLHFPYNYFTCTFAYQIALAMHEGFKTIGLFGVDLDTGTARERTVEKACVEFWMGLALGSGVRIALHDQSKLAHQDNLYGYRYHDEMQEVNDVVDGIVFERLRELEATGKAHRIDLSGSLIEDSENWKGNA